MATLNHNKECSQLILSIRRNSMVCALRLAQEKLMKAKYLIVKHAISTSSIGYLASIGNLGDIIKTIGINMSQRNRLNASLHVRAYNNIIYGFAYH